MLHHHSHHCIQGCALKSEGSKLFGQKVRILWTALGLIGCFALVELAIGYWSHSLALPAESGHMMSDSLALGLSLLAAWIAQGKPPMALTLALGEWKYSRHYSMELG